MFGGKQQVPNRGEVLRARDPDTISGLGIIAHMLIADLFTGLVRHKKSFKADQRSAVAKVLALRCLPS